MRRKKYCAEDAGYFTLCGLWQRVFKPQSCTAFGEVDEGVMKNAFGITIPGFALCLARDGTVSGVKVDRGITLQGPIASNWEGLCAQRQMGRAFEDVEY